MVVAWSLSFYAQPYLNFTRKSTDGMSITFQWYNLLAFGLYSVYNFLKTEFVSVQDKIFSVHATILTFLTIIQAAMYARNTAREGILRKMNEKRASTRNSGNQNSNGNNNQESEDSTNETQDSNFSETKVLIDTTSSERNCGIVG